MKQSVKEKGELHYGIYRPEREVSDRVPCQEVFLEPNNQVSQQQRVSGVVPLEIGSTKNQISHHPENQSC